MARKIIDITHSASQYDILSQTPKNYDGNNYFIKELQDKVDAEWCYRPNRVAIEYETVKATNEWLPIEVVMQTVKSDKGTAISNDYRRIVFKNIRENRFKIGSKFRFDPNYFMGAEAKFKDVWLATNTNQVQVTSSMVIERCNGILGSLYKDAQGVTNYHYEPVIQGMTLSSTQFSYGDVSVAPQSQLVITAQYNKYTNYYKINQRFIIGARQEDPENPGHFIDGQVYRITAINKFYGNTTNNPEDVGLIKIYMEITESSPYDDWDNMIAYQSEQIVHIQTDSDNKQYSIIFKTPSSIPNTLTSEELLFTPVVVAEDGTEYPNVSKFIQTTAVLDNWPSNKPSTEQSKYVLLTVNEATSTTAYSFKLQRVKMYTRGDLNVVCSVPAGVSPSGSEIKISFTLVVRQQE